MKTWRCHAVSENERTVLARVLKEGDPRPPGRLMNESHLSTELDYEVTGREPTRWCVPLGKRRRSGARMTGAGFGGRAIALVHMTISMPLKPTLPKVYIEEIAGSKLLHCRNRGRLSL